MTGRATGKWQMAVLTAIALIAGVTSRAGAGSRDDEKATADIRDLMHKYAQSVDAADSRLASEVWANSPDVSFIHPFGHEQGWDAIKTNIYERLMGETYSARTFTIKDSWVHANGDGAWAEFYWEFNAKLRKDGSPVVTRGRETQVYQRIGGRWRLVHVHYSGMPVAAGAGGS
jgi:ketosteroid isomerase-like protein